MRLLPHRWVYDQGICLHLKVSGSCPYFYGARTSLQTSCCQLSQGSFLVPDLVFCHADGGTSFWPIFLAFLLSCLLLSVDPALLCRWCSSPFICLQTVPGLAACVHLCLCTLASPLITLAWPFRFSFWCGHTFIPTSSLGPMFKLEHNDTRSFPSPSGSLICVVS